MSRLVDAATAAFDDLSHADAAFDAALERGDANQSAASTAHIMACSEAFADAVPSTAAGYRRKIADVDSLLQAVEDGDTLTPEGAARARRHLAALLAAITGPKIAA